MCTCVSAGNKCSLTRRDVVSGSHRLLHVLVLVEVLREPEVDQLHASHVPRRLHEPVLQLEVAMYDAMPMHVTNLIVAATAKTRIAARSIRLCELHRAYRLMEISRALYGAVFPIGSVRFGAVDRTEPHRGIFALLKTAPHRTVGFTMMENRTEPHRSIHEF